MGLVAGTSMHASTCVAPSISPSPHRARGRGRLLHVGEGAPAATRATKRLPSRVHLHEAPPPQQGSNMLHPGGLLQRARSPPSCREVRGAWAGELPRSTMSFEGAQQAMTEHDEQLRSTMSCRGAGSCGGSWRAAEEDWDTSTVGTRFSALTDGGVAIDGGAQREVSTIFWSCGAAEEAGRAAR